MFTLEKLVGKFALIVSMVLLVGCTAAEDIEPTSAAALPSATPVSTQIPNSGETPDSAQTAASTPSHGPTKAPESLPTSTQSPAPAQATAPNPVAIIVKPEGEQWGFTLVGGSENGDWISSADLAARDADSKYQVFTDHELQLRITENELELHEQEDHPFCSGYSLPSNASRISQSAVGVSGDWAVIPRTPEELSTESETYSEAVAAWLTEQSPSEPVVEINKIWRVDIQGDGTDEVFISATRFVEPTGHNYEPSDYSAILMRTVIGSEVRTVELVGDYYSEVGFNHFPLRYDLEFIGDLNGDGKMEVIVGISRWEGSGVIVFEVDGDEAEAVLTEHC